MGMDMQRKSDGRSAMGRDGAIGQLVTVSLPLPYEGIGNALRASYRPLRSDLPTDMIALLGKLDTL